MMSVVNGNTHSAIASGPRQACPLCSRVAARAAWKYREYSILRCRHCRLEFVSEMRSASLEFYQRQYSGVVVSKVAGGQVHAGYRFMIEMVKHAQARYLHPGQRRALDIGCGTGYTLSQLDRLGFQAMGIDFDPDLVAFAREHYRVHAEVGLVEDLGRLGRTYDLALLSHVLEHVERPLDLLQNTAQVLDPGGVLLIEVPNADRFSLNRSLRRGELQWGEYPPHHLTFWNTAALRFALDAAGYAILRCRALPFSHDDRLNAYALGRAWLPHRIRPPLVWVAGWLGQAAGLQGDVLHAIAQRRA
jgi:2-polyprenyl-3-methyl-5-hydroxy-6-metoxy-1,4-benzoquinol methylase